MTLTIIVRNGTLANCFHTQTVRTFKIFTLKNGCKNLMYFLDCHLYYDCENLGLPEIGICDVGLRFNPDLGYCDYEENVPCDPPNNFDGTCDLEHIGFFFPHPSS